MIFKSGEHHKIWNEQAQLNGADADAKLKRSCFKRLRRNNKKQQKHILFLPHDCLAAWQALEFTTSFFMSETGFLKTCQQCTVISGNIITIKRQHDFWWSLQGNHIMSKNDNFLWGPPSLCLTRMVVHSRFNCVNGLHLQQQQWQTNNPDYCDESKIMSFSLYMSLKIKSCHAHKNAGFLPTMPIVSDVSSFSECTCEEWQF